jgi:hypothetical protein
MTKPMDIEEVAEAVEMLEAFDKSLKKSSGGSDMNRIEWPDK